MAHGGCSNSTLTTHRLNLKILFSDAEVVSFARLVCGCEENLKLVTSHYDFCIFSHAFWHTKPTKRKWRKSIYNWVNSAQLNYVVVSFSWEGFFCFHRCQTLIFIWFEGDYIFFSILMEVTYIFSFSLAILVLHIFFYLSLVILVL